PGTLQDACRLGARGIRAMSAGSPFRPGNGAFLGVPSIHPLDREARSGQARPMGFGAFAIRMPAADEVLPGRAERMPVPSRHAVLGTSLVPPYPAGLGLAPVGMGWFWVAA